MTPDPRFYAPIPLDQRSDNVFTVHAECGGWRWWCHRCGVEKLHDWWDSAMAECDRHEHTDRLSARLRARRVA